MRKRYLTLIVFLCFVLQLKAREEMPIIAYWGVPDTMTYQKCFKDFRDCGFNVSIYPYGSIASLVKACDVASRWGVEIIGRCPEMFSSPIKVAQQLRNTKGFMGYMIQDEPSAPEMHQLQNKIELLKRIDDSHLFYINLLPYYRQDWFESSSKVKNYEDYLHAFSSTSCQQISFDFYPVMNYGIRTTWYKNLEQIRKESVITQKPFWGFALSVPHCDYAQPTLSSLRLQIYSNLAYGAQAIQYFTYWTPTPTKDYNFHDAPISRDGKKTKTYAVVQKMNRELRAVSRLFYGAKVLSVKHLGGKLPEGTSLQKTMPTNLKSLKVVTAKGAIISQLQKDGKLYMAVVNKDHNRSITVLIQGKNSTPRHITKALKEEPMNTSYNVSPGDILIFKLK